MNLLIRFLMFMLYLAVGGVVFWGLAAIVELLRAGEDKEET